MARIFIEKCLRDGHLAVISSDKPELVRKIMEKRLSFQKAQDDGNLVVYRWNKVFSPARRRDEFEKFFARKVKDARRSRDTRRRLCILGDMSESFFEKFYMQDEIEHFISRDRSNRRPSILCLYKIEGFRSRNTKELISVYKRHDAIVFNKQIFRGRGRAS